MNDTRLAELAAYILGETEQLKRMGEFFLDRSRNWERDYGWSNDISKEVNADETLVGIRPETYSNK